MYLPLMDFFGSEMTAATLYRHTASTNVGGKMVPGVTTDRTVTIADLQPVKPNELSKLSDGEHVSDYVKTYTADMDIQTRAGDVNADKIEVNGKTYEVFSVSNRRLGAFLKCILRKVG